MTHNIKALIHAINFLKVKYLIDKDYMEEDDVKRLLETIDGLEQMLPTSKTNLQRVISFSSKMMVKTGMFLAGWSFAYILYNGVSTGAIVAMLASLLMSAAGPLCSVIPDDDCEDEE